MAFPPANESKSKPIRLAGGCQMTPTDLRGREQFEAWIEETATLEAQIERETEELTSAWPRFKNA